MAEESTNPEVEDPQQEGDVGRREEIEEPAKLLRIAHMVRTTLDEVRTTELDEAGRDRLAELLKRSVDALSEVISDDLSDELKDVTEQLHDGTPSGPELRVAQAQLAGWLEGLFRGIQASMAAQQQSAQQQLQKMQKQGQLESGGSAGQYL